VEFTVTESGEVVLRGMTSVPADHAWFWAEQWQEGERKAAAQIAAGHAEVYADAESMFADLDRSCRCDADIRHDSAVPPGSRAS